MKVLFVSSGNAKDGISSITKAQGESLKKQGVQLEYFTINGKGLMSYISHIFKLRKFLRKNEFDIIHAHYSFSAYVATFASNKPIVTSLMGSDVLNDSIACFIIPVFFNKLWKAIIVKTDGMKSLLGIKNVQVIPNGVSMSKFLEINSQDCQKKLGWDPSKIHLLFGANPSRTEKNFKLAFNSVKRINLKNEIAIHTLIEVPVEEIATHLNAAHVLLLSSIHEGSPNIIKEAMACNCPIVATNVGDIKWLFGDIEGCYISDFSEENYSNKIKFAIEFSQSKGRTEGRKRIIELGLDAKSVAKKILEVYDLVLLKREIN